MQTAKITIDENADGLGIDVTIDLQDGIPPAKVELRGTIAVKLFNKFLRWFHTGIDKEA